MADNKQDKEITGTEEIECDLALRKAFRKACEAMSLNMLKKNMQGLRYSIHRLEMEYKIYQEIYDEKMDQAAQKRAGDSKGGEVNA